MDGLQKFFNNKKVLITGHTGFKGSWLSRTLLNWNANVVGVALEPATVPDIFNLLDIKNNITNYFVDIRNFKKVREIFGEEKPEMVFHLAAQPLVRDSYDDPLYTFETNIIGTANILQAIKETEGEVRSAIMVTTDKVYKSKNLKYSYKEEDRLGGHDPYSSSKVGAETVIDSYIKSFFNLQDYDKKHKTLIASVRSGNVIGGGDWSRDRIVPDVARSIFERNEQIVIRNPDSTRPWQYVLDPLNGYLTLAEKLYKGEKDFSGAWNFGPNKENRLTVKELVEEIMEAVGKGSYVVRRNSDKQETDYLSIDSNKAKNFLGWRPKIDLKKTIRLTFDWYENFYSKKNIIKITDDQIESFFK
ncbi:MAG: CDP-glucose 4,6-dehydratase [bacterium]